MCDANGGAFEDAELRGLVRTIIYLESIKPTTCSIEQKIKREYDRELENTTVSADKDKCFHELFIYFQSLFQLHNLTANSRAEKDALSSPLFPWGGRLRSLNWFTIPCFSYTSGCHNLLSGLRG